MSIRLAVRRLLCLLTGTVVAAGTALAAAPAAPAAASYTPGAYAHRLLYDMNVARARYGLPPLRAVYGLTLVAGGWSYHMSRTHVLAHNPYLLAQANLRCVRWSTLGENVGYGSTSNPDALFRAYWYSAAHRRNILNRSFRYVGVGVNYSGWAAWNTVDFANLC